MIPKNRIPIHPGEVLLEEFLKPMDMTQTALAEKLNIPIQRINGLINGRRDLSPETAILLSKVFKTSAETWMNLQSVYHLAVAQKHLLHA